MDGLASVVPVFNDLVEVLDLVGAKGGVGLKSEPAGYIHTGGKLDTGTVGILDVRRKVLTDVADKSGLDELVDIVHKVEVGSSAENRAVVLVAELIVIDVLSLRRRIASVVGEVVALRLTVAHRQ